MPVSRDAHATDTLTIDILDRQLLAEVADGSVRAFETLYRRYFPRLGRFLGRMTHNPALVEEVINDAMLVVWNKALSFDGSCKVATWIFAIAFRTAKKALRAVDLPLESDADSLEGDPCQAPEWQCEWHETQLAIAAALALLPPLQSAVVHLTYEHNLAMTEIAQILDCPVNTVKTRMFHARQRLKVLLANQQEKQR